MDFVSNKKLQLDAMLAEIGVKSFNELIADIPSDILYDKPSEDDGLSEFEGMKFMETLSHKNSFPHYSSYLGAGAYEHHVPAVVSAICSRGEFLTAYTPYQPEVSQGMLQAIFEYQSSVCALTGMDVANASLYDAASACAEACLLALRSRKKARKLFVAESLHPHYKQVIKQYLESHEIDWISIPFDSAGYLDLSSVESQLGSDTIGMIVQSPNFFGGVEALSSVFSKVKEQGGVTILCANPLSFGLFSSGNELNADVVVGDTQPFGIPLQYGGPYAGYIACKQSFVRQMPGRIIGETIDLDGKKGYVITLQAREQHIRREKATSNICTNQALAALASLIAIVWYGKEGVKKLALTNFQRSMYLKEQVDKIKGLEVVNKQTTFNEFILKVPRNISQIKEIFHEYSIVPGVELGKYYPEFKDCLLVSVTETKQRKDLDKYIEVAHRLK
jgi:glycine dehydrogenase subunit 1